MTEHPLDFTAVRSELRALNRGPLLIIAERAIELMPTAQLSTLLNDFVQLATCRCEAANLSLALLDDVREFCGAAMAGKYYETVEINNQGHQEQSVGADAFVAEFDRLVRRCTFSAEQGDLVETRNSIELLLDLLRHIDKGNDDVLFFADDGGSLNVGVNWRFVLPAYFKCLAAILSPAQFTRTVVSTVDEFVSYDSSYYLAAAQVVASDAQRYALCAVAFKGGVV